jgi:hypothetical protein
MERVSPTPAAGVDELGALFSALTVERAPDGRLRIEAPPHAARALATLFEGMATLLRDASTGAAAAPSAATGPSV